MDGKVYLVMQNDCDGFLVKLLNKIISLLSLAMNFIYNENV